MQNRPQGALGLPSPSEDTTPWAVGALHPATYLRPPATQPVLRDHPTSRPPPQVCAVKVPDCRSLQGPRKGLPCPSGGPPVTKLYHVPGIRHTAPGRLSHGRSPSHRARKLILSGRKQVTKLTAMELDPERDHSGHPHRRPGNPPDGSWPQVRPHTALMAQPQEGEVRGRRAVPSTASTPGAPSRRQSPSLAGRACRALGSRRKTGHNTGPPKLY